MRKESVPVFKDILSSPLGHGPLDIQDNRLICIGDGKEYEVVNNIPMLFEHLDSNTNLEKTTDLVRGFYEETPFPNYDSYDGIETFFEKANRSLFARLLNEQIPDHSLVLEVGCGTGQFSNYLGIKLNRTVIGCDMCMNSLILAEKFRNENSIDNAHFLHANLFTPPLKDDMFDFVYSIGALHHTPDPKAGFRRISRLVKSGGHIILGLYNFYGRAPTKIRKLIYDNFNADFLYKLDRQLKERKESDSRFNAWFRDQYAHPYESSHTADEVLRWFSDNNFRYVSSVPYFNGEYIQETDNLFKPQPQRTFLSRLITQLEMIFNSQGEGGVFIMIGQKV